MKTPEQQIIERYEAENCFLMLEDGFWYFWPTPAGAVPAWHLRAIANHLDRKNRRWERKIGWFLWWDSWKRWFRGQSDIDMKDFDLGDDD